jgi:hypothetical protein
MQHYDQRPRHSSSDGASVCYFHESGGWSLGTASGHAFVVRLATAQAGPWPATGQLGRVRPSSSTERRIPRRRLGDLAESFSNRAIPSVVSSNVADLLRRLIGLRGAAFAATKGHLATATRSVGFAALWRLRPLAHRRDPSVLRDASIRRASLTLLLDGTRGEHR